MKTWESHTQESRRVDATNAGFETRVKCGHGRELCVTLIQEREDRVKELLERGGESRLAIK